MNECRLTKEIDRLYYLLTESKCPIVFLDEAQKLRATKWLASHGVRIQKWIPVKEPPKEEGTYFVADEYGYVFTAFYWKEKRWWLRDGRRAYPTHWNTIQLPAPPKGE